MSLTLKKLVNQFLGWCEATLKAGTVIYYREHLNRWVRLVKNKQCKALRPLHLTTHMRNWHDWQSVQRCFNWAVDEAQVMKKNPFARVSSPGRNQRKRILSPQEMEQLLDAPHEAWRYYLLALHELAARPQEVRAIEWSDLQSDHPELLLPDALASGRAVFVLHEFKDKSKRREQDMPRVLLVTPKLGKLLQELLAREPNAEGKVFRNTRGKPWTKNAVRCMFRSMRRRLKIEPDKRGENVTAYTVRHSRATTAAASGVVDRILADWLGHVETRTTRRYQHLNVGHIREALRKMEAPPRVIAAKPEPRTDTPTQRQSPEPRMDAMS